MFEELKALDTIKLNFSQESLFLMYLTLAFIMFGVALDLKLSSFRKVFLYPKGAIAGVISQFLLLPAITFFMVIAIKLTPSVALGMILVASCPGGNISNFISSLAKAHTELSITLTAIATLAAIIMTPLNFALWGGWYTKIYGAKDLLIPIEIDPVQMFKTVFILLGIPLIAGLVFAWKFPKLTARIRKPIKILSILIFFGFVVAAFTANFDYFLKYIKWVIVLVLIHNFIALMTGYSFAGAFRLPEIKRRTLAIETGIQNSGLGLVLIFNPKLFNGIGGMAFIAAWWGIWHIISGMGIAYYWSRRPVAKD